MKNFTKIYFAEVPDNNWIRTHNTNDKYIFVDVVKSVNYNIIFVLIVNFFLFLRAMSQVLCLRRNASPLGHEHLANAAGLLTDRKLYVTAFTDGDIFSYVIVSL